MALSRRIEIPHDPPPDKDLTKDLLRQRLGSENAITKGGRLGRGVQWSLVVKKNFWTRVSVICIQEKMGRPYFQVVKLPPLGPFGALLGPIGPLISYLSDDSLLLSIVQCIQEQLSTQTGGPPTAP